MVPLRPKALTLFFRIDVNDFVSVSNGYDVLLLFFFFLAFFMLSDKFYEVISWFYRFGGKWAWEELKLDSAFKNVVNHFIFDLPWGAITL